ncbi:hypothetical protein J7E87_26675 [Streptomyces sp. ISL-1]|nr:hypothetical protein [Streptomyces sp. ISL-1]
MPVRTVVDIRNLGEGGGALTVDSRWAHLDGPGGWIFPGGTGRLRALREDRTGAWSDIHPNQLHRSASLASLTPSGSTTAPPRWTASTACLPPPGASRRTVTARARDGRRVEIRQQRRGLAGGRCPLAGTDDRGLLAARYRGAAHRVRAGERPRSE